MPPKKGKKGSKKSKKSARPAWMSEEMFALSTNLPKLCEIWSGDIKDNKKPDALPIPAISREQAGLFIWQIVFPSHKAALAKRVESVKLGLIETSVKVLGSGKGPDMTPAVGILTAMTQDNEQCRTTMLESKPAVLPNLLHALEMDSASLKAAVCSLLRVLASSDDTRLRLWRALREWEWTPLLSALKLQELSQLGGRNAALDAMLAVEALCSAREPDIANAACGNVHKYGGVRDIVEVLQNRVSHPISKAAGITVLNNIMRRAPAALCEEIVITNGGLAPIVAIFAHMVVPLLRKAHAAAILLRYILPDSLWKDSSALSRSRARSSGAAAGGSPTRPATSGSEGVPTFSGGGALGAPVHPSMVAPDGIEGGGEANGAADHGDPGPPQADNELLDEATKKDIVNRARRVAEAGAIPWLVRLCVGPDGPLPDLEAKASADAAAGEATEGEGEPGKKKKKKKSKKKKAKLEPGQAEAQSWATAVLRLVSMGEDMRPMVVAAGALRYLLPLLDSRIGPTRWNVRQTLVNMSMSPMLMPTLILYKVPEYLSGSNMPDSHFMRLGAPPDPSALAVKKPPALKPIKNIDGGPKPRPAASTSESAEPAAA